MADQTSALPVGETPESRPKFTDLPLSEQMKASAMLADELLESGVFDKQMSRDQVIEQCHQQLATLPEEFFDLPQALFDLSDEDLGQLIHDLVNNPAQE
jgi:hypothetical protein